MLDFEIKDPNSNANILVFFGEIPASWSAGVAAEFFEIKLRKRLHPDAIIILTPEYAKGRFEQLFSDSGVRSNIERFHGTGVAKMYYDVSGFIWGLDNALDPEVIAGLDRTYLCNLLKVQGLRKLAEKNAVIEEAPPGTAFKKPSATTSKEFLVGSKICSSLHEVEFVVFCMLDKLKHPVNIRKFYVDTQSIIHIPLGFMLCLNKFGVNISAQVESFGSYGKESFPRKPKDFDPEVDLVIISASSSNNLMEKVVSSWRAKEERVLTLLSYKGHGRVLVDISSMSKFYGNKELAYDMFVSRVNENFTAEVMSPKAVVIKAIHGNRSLDKELIEYGVNQNSCVFRCNYRDGGAHHVESASDEFFVTFKNLSSDQLDWLHMLGKWHVPASTTGVILRPGDHMSEQVAQAIESSIGRKINRYDAGDLLKQDFDNTKDALLVIEPVINSGSCMININRDLRTSNHDGQRIFVSLLHLYHGKKNKDQFQKSLVYGPDLTKYKVLIHRNINLSERHEDNNWICEKRHIESKEYYSSPFWEARLRILRQQGDGLNGHIGVSGKGPEYLLGFSRHFAFWDKITYSGDEASREAVYFTIAHVLQNARDSDEFSVEDSLRGNVYQQAVLSPEVFSRFNDPILQSCLWRAAKLSEIDYSSDEKLSGHFVDILLRLARNHDNDKGEATIDLLLGVAMRNIRLTNCAYKRLVSGLDGLDLPEHYSPLIKDIKGTG